MSHTSTEKTTPGRHRATDYAPADRSMTTLVPDDIRDALTREVEALDETYRDKDWSFGESTILMWIATRTTPVGAGRDRLVFAPDARAAWVPAGQDPEAVVGDLVRTSPMSRSHVEMLLDDHARFGTGEWHFQPVRDLGWLCSRKFRLRGRKHFLVSREEHVLEVPAISTLDAEPLLRGMVGPATSDDSVHGAAWVEPDWADAA